MTRYSWTWRACWGILAGGGFTTGACTLDAEGTSVMGDTGPEGRGGMPGTGSVGTAGASGSILGGGTGGVAGSISGGLAGAGSGGTTSEDCADGIDNDGDGQSDCADDDCRNQGFSCIPPVPEEWIGYFRIKVQPNAASAPPIAECPSGSDPERYLSGRAGRAECEPCSCGPLENAQCDFAGIACDYDGSNCANAEQRNALMASGCHARPFSGEGSCHLTGVNLIKDAGSCEPSPPVPDFTNKLPFNKVVDVCVFADASSGLGCGESNVCLPPGSGDYAGSVCVMKGDKDATCPPGWNAKPSIRLFKEDDATDDRGCTECECEPQESALQCEGGSYRVWDMNDCSSCPTADRRCSSPVDIDSTSCQDLTELADLGSSSIKVQSMPKPKGGKCTPGGGEPTGGISVSKSARLCCL